MIPYLFEALILALFGALIMHLWRVRRSRNAGSGYGLSFILCGFVWWSGAAAVEMSFFFLSGNAAIDPGVDLIGPVGVAALMWWLGCSCLAIGLIYWITCVMRVPAAGTIRKKILDKFRPPASESDLLLSSLPVILYRVRLAPDYWTPEITMLNDKVEDLLGYERKIFDEDPELFGKLLHPEDRASLESTIGEVWNGDRGVLEHRFLHADGEYRWLRRHVHQIRDESGQVVEYIGCAFEITDLKQAEERLENFLEGAPDAVVTVDEEGLMIMANYQATQLFGYEQSEMVGQRIGTLVPQQLRKKQREELMCYLEEQSIRPMKMNMEFSCIRKDGTEVPVEITLSHLEAKGQKLMAAAFRDISDRKKVEAQLQQAQKMEAVGQLTGGIAHDFNNLLTIVIGNLQLIEMTSSLDDSSQRTVQSALEAALRGAELTKRLLAFSRQQLLAPKITDLNELVAGIQTLIRRTLGASVTLETHQAENLWPTRVDPSQVENSLINLAINARDAMPSGGTVSIETSNITLDDTYAAHNSDVTPGEYVLVAVSDNGMGIPKDKLAKVFDPFFSTKEVGKGSGLGLSMVYGFAKQSGGHIKIYSEEGHGTTVKLYLPRSQPAYEELAQPTISVKAIDGGDELILLVEDEPAVREIAATLLTGLGYCVHQAESGPAALARLDELAHVDLLFTDIVMPGGMTGVELADQVRQRYPKLKVLYTSGYTESKVFDDGLLRPDDLMLSKPYLTEKLAQTVRDALDKE